MKLYLIAFNVIVISGLACGRFGWPPAGKYVVFIYKGKVKDSIKPMEWFPKSNSQLNENARVDFVRYGEKTNEKGESRIEVWIPVAS